MTRQKHRAMFAPLVVGMAALALSGCETSSALLSTVASPSQKSESMFNGKDVSQWQMVGAGSFSIENGSLRSEGGPGVLWYAKQQFTNFEMTLEWKANRKSADSGVFVRIPDIPVSHNQVRQTSVEIQINDSADDPLQQTGAIAGRMPSTHTPVNPPGEWNQLKIICHDNAIDVWVNQQHVSTSYAGRSPFGYIGLENHDRDSMVWFRNIRIQPRP